MRIATAIRCFSSVLVCHANKVFCAVESYQAIALTHCREWFSFRLPFDSECSILRGICFKAAAYLPPNSPFAIPNNCVMNGAEKANKIFCCHLNKCGEDLRWVAHHRTFYLVLNVTIPMAFVLNSELEKRQTSEVGTLNSGKALRAYSVSFELNAGKPGHP